jgi:hypothetical protein
LRNEEELMMKKIRLSIDYGYDFEVLAVISSVKDYKLAWAINRCLNIHLCKSSDIFFGLKKEQELLISNFIFETEYTTFRLLKNKSFETPKNNTPYLIPELKDYDYLIKITGQSISFNSDAIIEKLKELPLVEYIKKVDIQNLKSRENLIF